MFTFFLRILYQSCLSSQNGTNCHVRLSGEAKLCALLFPIKVTFHLGGLLVTSSKYLSL